MQAKTALRRRYNVIPKSVRAISRRSSLRAAEEKFHIPRTTLWRAMQLNAKPKEATWRCALTETEERAIVDLVLRCADRGLPLARKHLADAAEIVTSTLSFERQSELSFNESCPGIKWIRSFYKQHKKTL